MTQPAIPLDEHRVLTDLELRDVTGIKTKDRSNFRMTPKIYMDIATTFARAGIFFWYSHDNSRLFTTWHHIYNPNRPEPAKNPDEPDSKKPNFMAMKK